MRDQLTFRRVPSRVLCARNRPISRQVCLCNMFPEVYACPECKREFVVRDETLTSVECPSCGRYIGERHFTTVVETEIEELIARLAIEIERLEEDEAVYGEGEHSAELMNYGSEVHRILAILRRTNAELRALRATYR